jgi:hypothetical protein
VSHPFLALSLHDDESMYRTHVHDESMYRAHVYRAHVKSTLLQHVILVPEAFL